MAFWGIELKPGKPYVHLYDDDYGRLHLSQATLGSGTSTKKIIVQCKVGDKMPINLCSLFPEILENCALNLEFEECQEVTFSVIGTHTVHLSGFFFGEDEDELEPLEDQDIETDSETDEFLEYDSEDEDEDDYIDDEEDDIDMYPSTRSSGVKIEEILDDEKAAKEDATSRQGKKNNNQKVDPNNNNDSGKQLVFRGSSGVPELESEDEDGFPISSPSKRADGLTSTSKPDATNDENIVEETQQKKSKDDFGQNKSLKRKIDVVEQYDQQLREISGTRDLTANTSVAASANDPKQKKNNKKKKSDNKADVKREIDSNDSILKKANPTVVAKMDNGLEPIAKMDKEKKKKKKKNKESVVASEAEQTVRDKSVAIVETEEKAGDKPFQVRSFPNGLVIEELAMGKPDGKKADSGRKVSVRYVGKLKNGKIFDSNIGRAPFKFRLGIGQVIKGWDVGVKGMRVGDKRRLTIPPAMGYGAKGAGAIPPNSWLVFNVELVDVN